MSSRYKMLKVVFTSGILLFALTPVLSQSLGGLFYIPIIIGGIGLLIKNWDGVTSDRKALLNLFFFIVPFLITVFTFFYTNNLGDALKYLGKSINFLIMAFLFLIPFVYNKYEKLKLERNFSNVYIGSTIIYSIYVILNIYLKGYYNGEINKSEMLGYIHYLMPYIRHTPIYLSVVNALSLLLVIKKVLERSSYQGVKYYIFLSIAFILDTYLLFFYAKRSVVIGLLFCLSLLLITLKLNKSKRLRSYWFVFLIIIVINIFLVPISHLIQKFFSGESIQVRTILYECFWDLMSQKPFFGYGLRGEKYNLVDCYVNKGVRNVLWNKDLNSHNQYYAFYLYGGVFGFLGFLSFFVKAFYSSLFKKNSFVPVILTFFMSIMLFENLLDRDLGVRLVSFFIGFYLCFSNDLKRELGSNF